jgi:hypothetical protein
MSKVDDVGAVVYFCMCIYVYTFGRIFILHPVLQVLPHPVASEEKERAVRDFL